MFKAGRNAVAFLDIFKIAWPIAVTLVPIILTAGILWLRSQFPTKGELEAVRVDVATKIAGSERRLTDKLEEHEARLEAGSRKMAELDKRTALVEEECKQVPSRNTLQSELSHLAQRIRGVEVQGQAANDQLSTQNTYLHTLIERGLGLRL
ncbi:hypothetical protein ASE73_02690 [Sphingomonas sp. Leaf24]|nr:hypothetical protein ASE50_02690 [Sphingomonas sp. Leaf5]KQM96009.1 hypothetical protein ASE73_02690 [Sphingomonas sp. Leaf24]